MTRVFLADALTEERAALRLMLLDLNMEIAGESADWSTTLAQAPISRTDMLLVDWDYSPARPLRLLMNSERLAQPRWSLSSSAISTPVSKLHSPLALMRLSVKVSCRTVWPNACEPSQPVFL